MSATEEMLALALDYHRAGALAQAEPLYRQILQADPHHAGTLHLLGVLAAQTGHADQAIDLFQQALRINPQAAPFHNSLGNALRDQARLDDAVRSYRQALALQPDYVTAYHNLGAVLQKQGRCDEAEACYRQALQLQPDSALAHFELGNALQALGRLAEATASYRQVLYFEPHHPGVLNNLGNVLAKLGQLAEAADCYQQALALQPANAAVHCNLGNVLRDQGKAEEAVRHYRHALRLQPDYAMAYSNLGNVLVDQGQLKEAECHCWEAVRLQPDFAGAYNNLSIALYGQGRLEEALANSRRAVQLQPDCHEAHNNLGNVLKDQGKVAEAIASYRRALQLQPNDALAHKNLGMTLLLSGEFEQGWAEYEWRWQCPDFVRPNFPQPLWDGAALQGRTILLRAEQGLGDTLQFIRYAALVKARGGTVLAACQESLMRVLDGCPGIDRLLPLGEPLPPFDVYAPLLTLPRLFGTTLANVPHRVPYLFADPRLIEHWRHELGASSCFRVGIVWHGNPRHAGDRQRSVPLEMFAPLARLERVELVSLQKGPGAEQLAAQAGRFAVTDLWGQARGDWPDTAAVMKCLDLVITVDTATSHLAGALGVPVWVLLTCPADWRWLLHGQHSPWYPSARLFRQPAPGDWPSVIAQVANELRNPLRTGLKKGSDPLNSGGQTPF